ncbi:SET_domain-containing protein [Hexamita inflata]|uniref:SET domain-containing protein n=1 Tax=Hexamita inflata TaxID=28002 RepID=A0AA86UMN9_9EUKA|nr:SET domain-containing protein [Hexamita inflata]
MELEQFLNHYKIIKPEEIKIIQDQWQRGWNPIKILKEYKIRNQNLILRNQLLEKFKQNRLMKNRTYNYLKKQGVHTINAFIDGFDPIPFNNVCQLSEDQLKQVQLEDLETNKIYENCILWGTVICDPYKVAGCYILIEDDNYEVIEVQLFNSVPFNVFQDVLDQIIQDGCIIGIKNPYKMMCLDNIAVIRNDNPSNIIIRYPQIENQLKSDSNAINLLERGYQQQEQNNLQSALKLYEQALKYSQHNTNQSEIQIQIYLNIATVYQILEDYQEAVHYCNIALKIDPSATCISDLQLKLLESLQDYNKLCPLLDKNSDTYKRVIQKSNMQKAIFNNEIHLIFSSAFAKQKRQFNDFLNNFCNYYGPIEIKSTNFCRGLYATQDIQSNQIVIIEAPLQASSFPTFADKPLDEQHQRMAQQMPDMYLLNDLVMRCQNNPNLRKQIAQLYSGKFRQDCPDIKADVINQYYKEKPRYLSASEIWDVIEMNSLHIIRDDDANHIWSMLFHVISFINHQNNPNTILITHTEHYGVIFSTKFIKKGEQITMDYVPALKGDEKKNALLAWGIQ